MKPLKEKDQTSEEWWDRTDCPKFIFQLSKRRFCSLGRFISDLIAKEREKKLQNKLITNKHQ